MDKLLNKESKSKILEILNITVLCCIVFWGVRQFVAVPVSAYGESMSPTIENNDTIIFSKLNYLFTEPKQNDIIIFPYGEKSVYVKRIIGVPGDTINMIDGVLYLNEEVYEDDFSKTLKSYGDREYPIILEEDEYYVLGDNREISKDSRYSSVGNVPREDILGKGVLILYPFKNFEFLK